MPGWLIVLEIVCAVANAVAAVSGYHAKRSWKFSAGLAVLLTVLACSDVIKGMGW